jgi:ATP-binding cassette subfamily C (CFTR/MRP) protein 1
MSSGSSFTEKNEDWRHQDQETAANEPRSYEPIVSESDETAAVNKDLEASGNGNATHEKQHNPNHGTLSRLQSSTSGVSEWSEDLSATDTRSSGGKKEKKKWYKKMNPLKWGAKPPVPAERGVSREYTAGVLSKITFQWMAPLMTVSSDISI